MFTNSSLIHAEKLQGLSGMPNGAAAKLGLVHPVCVLEPWALRTGAL